MDSGIYKIVNTVTGKCYVGSAKNFSKRWACHFKDLRARRHSSIKLQQSFNKYGENVFIPEIIEEIEYTKNVIIERENYWIKTLNSKENGYNIADASFGDVLSNHPDKAKIIQKISKSINENVSKMSDSERKAKWALTGKLNPMYGRNDHCTGINERSKAIKGKTFEEIYGDEKAEKLKSTLRESFTEDRKAKLSMIAKNRVNELNPFYGKTHSDEAKLKMSKAKKGTKNTACHKAVIVDGIEYSCLNDAFKSTGIKATTIWHRCRSKNPKYKNTYLKEFPKPQ